MLRVHLGERSYDIALSTGDSGPLVRLIENVKPSLAFLVTDENVRPHALRIADSIKARQVEIHTIPSGEVHKSMASAMAIYDRLAELQADRRTLIVAVGGGVVGDLAGFAAATYTRGLPLLMVPTTLLAMVDSSVGGKVGVNHPRGKNLIGAFHQPIGVWIEPAFLDTLPDREYQSGLAEVVKYGVILDPELLAWLENNGRAINGRDHDAIRHIVLRSCALKAHVVEQDERDELGRRVILNFGHTFGHAFETVTSYGTLLHGEAVALGMMCACRLAHERQMIDGRLVERLRDLLRALGLPVDLSSLHTTDRFVDDVLHAMAGDKKAEARRIRVLLPVRLGEVRLFDDVSHEELRAALP